MVLHVCGSSMETRQNHRNDDQGVSVCKRDYDRNVKQYRIECALCIWTLDLLDRFHCK